jgi:hypothetical protein
VKSLCLLIVFLVFIPLSVAAQGLPHVRPVDAWAEESLARAESRSASVRTLIRELQESDVIVHVATTPSLRNFRSGMTRFVATTGSYRYLRIDLDRGLLPDWRAAVLGHELQHACEIARSQADSQLAIRALFSEIGSQVDGQANVYETAEAVETTTQVWRELRAGSRLIFTQRH